jgi:anti-sigma regulatory factor (Ser/Thr protein kinase)
MRTGAAAGHRGYYHEAVYYSSPDDLLEVVVPFLHGGLAAGEPTIVAFGDKNAALVQSAMPSGSGVVYLRGDDTYARPAGAVRAYRQILADHVVRGAGQIRIIGEMPPDNMRRSVWDWWARYESATNHAYDEFPLWSMCAYDTRSTPHYVLADIDRTHPRVATPGGRHTPIPAYVPPERFLLERTPVVADPIQHGSPLLDLTDPTPASARAAVEAAIGEQLPASRLQQLLIAVSEAVTNALRHGRPPVRLRAWTGDGRAVVTVGDSGGGPTDPYAGLLPASNGSPGGLGLWLIHQLCDHVIFDRVGEGFMLRLTAGAV